MLRESLKQFGAVEDTFVYFNSLEEEVSFPCWSKVEDDNIRKGYARAVEVENGDKASLSVESVSEVSNAPVRENTDDEKPYTDRDLEDAKDLF